MTVRDERHAWWIVAAMIAALLTLPILLGSGAKSSDAPASYDER